MASRLGRPRRRTIALVIVAVLVLVAGGAAWYLQPQPLLPEAQESLGAKPDTVDVLLPKPQAPEALLETIERLLVGNDKSLSSGAP